MSLKDLFSRKSKNVENKPSGFGIGKKSTTKNKNEDSTFLEEDFMKDSDRDNDVEMSTLNTQDGKANVNLQTDNDDSHFLSNRFDTVSEADSSSSFEDLSFDVDNKNLDNDLFNIKKEETKDNESSFEDSISENELLALYEEEKKVSKNEIEEDGVLAEQIAELNSLYEQGTALKQEESKEDRLNSSLAFDDDSFDRATTIDESEDFLNKDTNIKIKGDTISNLDLNTKSSLDRDSVSDLDLANFETNIGSDTLQDKKKIKKKEKKKKSIFGKIPVKTQYALMFTTLVIGAAGLGGSFYVETKIDIQESNAYKITNDMIGEKEKLSVKIKESILGLQDGYKGMLTSWANLRDYQQEIIRVIDQLKNERANDLSLQIINQIDEVSKLLDSSQKEEFMFKEEYLTKEKIYTSSSKLMDLTNKLIDIQIGSGKSKESLIDFYLLKEDIMIVKDAGLGIISGENHSEDRLVKLKNSYDKISSKISSLIKDKELMNFSEEGNKLINDMQVEITKINVVKNDLIKGGQDFAKAKDSLKGAEKILEKTSVDIKGLMNVLESKAHANAKFVELSMYVSILLLLLSVGGLSYIYRFESRRKAEELSQEAEENKRSIFKLLDEMIYLQDGNLSQKTTVEEGSITMDIADSVNATIDSLSVVVRKIKESSLMMGQKTNSINMSSLRLLSATEKQTASILGANTSINDIAQAIADISNKTKESLVIAKNSAKVSGVGSNNVNDSIETMRAINKNMEETVVLMRKVSDSSTQISEVIGLLSDITEETNILALNASVQAAKAGAAGKGFKVVAESIQELADNAAEATRRVGALIATVQTDIQSVSDSVKKTTDEVVKGVSLSENAGRSLNEIAETSNKLAEIVETISAASIANAESAKQISVSMGEILGFTEETKETTKETAESISEIDKVSTDLNDSVKTFIVD